jgi:hypothetical protein
MSMIHPSMCLSKISLLSDFSVSATDMSTEGSMVGMQVVRAIYKVLCYACLKKVPTATVLTQVRKIKHNLPYKALIDRRPYM